MVRISVVICTFNRAAVLRRALDAYRNIAYPVNEWELVIVDNGSPDQTLAVVESYAAESAATVRYVEEKRLGHSYALNAGIAAANGEFVAFTDDDACPYPDWLGQIEAAFDEHKADAVFGPAVPLWERSEPRWFGPRLRPNFALLDYGPDSFLVNGPEHPFYGVNHAWRTAVIKQLGGYRTDRGGVGNQGGAGNDEDLFSRALASDLRIAYTPSAKVQHMIPEKRCRKQFHRMNMWRAAKAYSRVLHEQHSDGPWLCGVPRWFYGLLLSHTALWLRHTVTFNPCEAFYHELKAIRLLSLVWQGLKNTRLGTTKEVMTERASHIT